MKELIDYLNSSHVFQFFLAVILTLLYYSTYMTGRPSDLFQSLTVVAVTFFFVNQTTSGKFDRQDIKIEAQAQAIKKIATGESKKV